MKRKGIRRNPNSKISRVVETIMAKGRRDASIVGRLAISAKIVERKRRLVVFIVEMRDI